VPPKGELARMKPRNCSSFNNNAKRVSYYFEMANLKKHDPAPTKYAIQKKWTDSTVEGQIRPKGKFLAQEKLTMTASVMNFTKHLPSPNKYNKVI
jgi:hypothetical protein